MNERIKLATYPRHVGKTSHLERSVDHKAWFEAPFMYDPFWQRRATRP